MLYAYEQSTNNSITAKRGVVAICPICRELVIPKCGKLVAPHFAHKSKSECASEQYDRKTPWHYKWQNKIINPKPGVNVEVRIKGEYLKIADVVTPSGIIIEFQHSPLTLEERLLRESHYKNMVWVIHRSIEERRIWKTKTNIPILIDYDDGHNLLEYYNRGRYRMRINPLVFKAEFMNGNVSNLNDILE